MGFCPRYTIAAYNVSVSIDGGCNRGLQTACFNRILPVLRKSDLPNYDFKAEITLFKGSQRWRIV